MIIPNASQPAALHHQLLKAVGDNTGPHCWQCYQGCDLDSSAAISAVHACEHMSIRTFDCQAEWLTPMPLKAHMGKQSST